MLIVDGYKYLRDKELSFRYGLSVHWFRKVRQTGKGPNYYIMNGHVYYNEEQVKDWFKNNLKSKE